MYIYIYIDKEVLSHHHLLLFSDLSYIYIYICIVVRDNVA